MRRYNVELELADTVSTVGNRPVAGMPNQKVDFVRDGTEAIRYSGGSK